MTKLASLIAGVSVAALSISAASAATSVDINLEGILEKECDISAFVNGPFPALDMTTTSVQGSESVTVNCNYGGSASVEFASANSGSMVSGGDSVPYTFYLSGSPFSGGVSLATPQTWNGFPTVANSDQTRGMSVSLNTPATVPGTYTDTITATVTPN